MSWTIQQPPNPIVVNDAGVQVSNDAIVWKDKNNATIVAETPIAEVSDSTWVNSLGVELIEGEEVVQMTPFLWNNGTETLTWDGQNYTENFSSNRYNDIGVVFETSWG